jgi:hypothetical protein
MRVVLSLAVCLLLVVCVVSRAEACCASRCTTCCQDCDPSCQGCGVICLSSTCAKLWGGCSRCGGEDEEETEDPEEPMGPGVPVLVMVGGVPGRTVCEGIGAAVGWDITVATAVQERRA